jgi:hypothetical protein
LDHFFLEEGIKQCPIFQKQVVLAKHRIKQYPAWTKQYLKAAAAASAKGKVPFIHGQAPRWRAARLFMEEISTKKGSSFRYLRHPSSLDSIKRSALWDKLTDLKVRTGNNELDLHPEIRSHLVSCSYSLWSNLTYLDSAFSYLFSRSHEWRQGYQMTTEKREKFEKEEVRKIVFQFLEKEGLPKDRIDQTVQKLCELSQGYEEFSINSAYLIAVPREKVNLFTYDSERFGVPTGKDALDVIDFPQEHKERFAGKTPSGGLQARILVCAETLDQRSGIDNIDLMNPEEAKEYAKGISMTSPEKVPAFSDLVSHISQQELLEQEKRYALDERIRQLARTCFP